MLYNTLRFFDETSEKKVSFPIRIEAYARHAFTLMGELEPLSHRPEFDSLFHSPHQAALVGLGRRILSHFLRPGVMLGESGELKDRIGTPEQFRKQILYHLSKTESTEEIQKSARLIDSADPDDLRGIAIFALAEPEAFCEQVD